MRESCSTFTEALCLARPILAWPAFVNARNDPLTVLMRCFRASFAFRTEIESDLTKLTDAIYTTQPEMSLQNIGATTKFQ
jgi:hypothetical protein